MAAETKIMEPEGTAVGRGRPMQKFKQQTKHATAATI
jgi:hypothetical protein